MSVYACIPNICRLGCSFLLAIGLYTEFLTNNALSGELFVGDDLGSEQRITISVAPFAGRGGNAMAVGKRASAILNLQIWQTLRIPLTNEGRHTKGVVTWDLDFSSPTSFAEAENYAGASQDQEPQLVLWGRAWELGQDIVAEAFLSIRSGDPSRPNGANLWTVKTTTGVSLSVGVPRRQIEFAPIVIRSKLLPELSHPAGLILYASPSGNESLGAVGDYFRAREHGLDSAKVVLRDGREGWIRLPHLSREKSEIVDFAGGVVRILRSDWVGATLLFQRVVNNEHAPTAVKSDAELYLAIAAARSGEDPLPWIQKAYELTPYSRTTIQYLCMAKLAYLQRAGLTKESRRTQIAELRRIVVVGAPLYAREDSWFRKIREFLDNIESKS